MQFASFAGAGSAESAGRLDECTDSEWAGRERLVKFRHRADLKTRIKNREAAAVWFAFDQKFDLWTKLKTTEIVKTKKP